MASMTAKAYLTKVIEICQSKEEAEQCTEGCPLRGYGCGTPTGEKQIDTVIELVKNYKITKSSQCAKCGRDNTELIKNQDIKFCPYCGTAIDCEAINSLIMANSPQLE